MNNKFNWLFQRNKKQESGEDRRFYLGKGEKIGMNYSEIIKETIINQVRVR